jgi:hypothetical protein
MRVTEREESNASGVMTHLGMHRDHLLTGSLFWRSCFTRALHSSIKKVNFIDDP